MRMLLVEDDPMIGESIQQGLRQDGITVDWVQDGEAAELALRITAYALVLLDLGLPRKSGLEVLTTLRRTGHQRDLIPRMQTRAELYDLLGYTGYEERDKRYFGGK